LRDAVVDGLKMNKWYRVWERGLQTFGLVWHPVNSMMNFQVPENAGNVHAPWTN